MYIQVSFYVLLVVVSLLMVLKWRPQDKNANIKVYSRDLMLSYLPSSLKPPKDWKSIDEAKRKFISKKTKKKTSKPKVSKSKQEEANENKENLVHVDQNSLEKGSDLKKSYEESVKTFGKLNTEAYENFIQKSLDQNDIKSASFFLGEMDNLGLEVKRALLNSYLSVYNSQKRPLYTRNEKTYAHEFPAGLSLNPNAAEFVPTIKIANKDMVE
ncbi:unnamed protein product [Blepharisma stoltei]|uniref:ATP synthase F0 subunit 8 n=1 Tax=Blepharisma stoltei TaxID=1481888 RepID=A0AAU9K0N8_9CILI|nr:unnamed protein product [Blepharisma stoltei]